MKNKVAERENNRKEPKTEHKPPHPPKKKKRKVASVYERAKKNYPT